MNLMDANNEEIQDELAIAQLRGLLMYFVGKDLSLSQSNVRVETCLAEAERRLRHEPRIINSYDVDTQRISRKEFNKTRLDIQRRDFTQ